MRRRLTTKEFVDKAINKHGNLYDYTNTVYIKMKSKVTIKCYKHGNFNQQADSHLSGKGCPKCSNNNGKKTTEEFIQESSKIHNNRYSYKNAIYKANNKKLYITCNVHGDFLQIPSAHLSGQGCPKCNQVGVYSENFFNQNPQAKDQKASLYFIKLSNDSEAFWKVGITQQTNLNNRFDKISNYNCEIINIVETTLYDAFCLEQNIKEEYSSSQYIPKHKFGGHTECFSVNIFKQ